LMTVILNRKNIIFIYDLSREIFSFNLFKLI
jgi:hypothetical protein